MKKIQVLLKPQCNAEIQNQFATKFGDQCEFTFQGKETEDAIAAAEVVIGEPEEEEILKAENLRWIQLTWGGISPAPKESITIVNILLYFFIIFVSFLLSYLWILHIYNNFCY